MTVSKYDIHRFEHWLSENGHELEIEVELEDYCRACDTFDLFEGTVPQTEHKNIIELWEQFKEQENKEK